MKRLMLTAAALALLSTAAQADDFTVAKGMWRSSLYDKHCEKIPGLETTIKLLLEEIPASTMQAALVPIKQEFESTATIKWCATYQPRVNSLRGN